MASKKIHGQRGHRDFLDGTIANTMRISKARKKVSTGSSSSSRIAEILVMTPQLTTGSSSSSRIAGIRIISPEMTSGSSSSPRIADIRELLPAMTPDVTTRGRVSSFLMSMK
jgi:tellurite resistance protein